MLEVVIVLALVALVVLFFRAGRQNTIVYRRKVADCDRKRFVSDQPQMSGSSSDNWLTGDSSHDNVAREAFAFEGGDFGGGGAGDSYDTGGIDWNSNDSASSSDSGSCDSSSCDSSSDSTGSDSSGSDSSWSSSD